MKEKKSHLTGLLICLTVAVALLLGAYLYVSMTNPALLTLPSWVLYAIAGALGLLLILTIIQGVSAKKAKKKAMPEKEDEESEQEGEEEKAEEETQEVEAEEDKEAEAQEEVQAEEEAEVEEANDEELQAEDEPQEEIKEEEPQEDAQETQPEEEAKEEAQPEDTQEEEEPQAQEEQEPEEEKEEMVAEENEEAKPAPIAAEVEEQPEEAQEEPVQEEVKEEPKAAEPEKEVVTPSIAAFISDQQKLNENIEKRLEGIDNSLKVIADALRSLLYDAVPAGVTTVAVSTKEVPQPEPEPESDVADGGNYFEQVEQEQKIEDQNAEIAENYADGWIATADQDSRIKPKMSFEMRLRVADEDIKRFYSDIKNELLSYGIHDRISRHRENFNQGRINICRMVINGKTLKIYLAVDPESIDKRYFHHTDVGHRKGLVELPTMINVRSKVAARKVKELITLMMESLVISKKPYEEHDFAADLTAEGFTTVECKGFDYLVEKSISLDKAKEYPDSFAAQLLEMVEDNEYQERFIKTYLSLDDIAKNFKAGDVVDIDKVRELGLGPANSNFLSIKESKKLDKKFKVYANEYTPDAVKMICLAGGESFLVIQPEKTIEEV